MTIESAKKFLELNGFFTDNLWSIDDVKGKFNCTDEQAQHVLSQSLTNDATMEQIWLSIDIFGDDNNLPKVVKDKNGDIINVGDSVEVEEPKVSDNYKFGFVGTVITLDSVNDFVIVEDMDGDCFTVDADCTEIQ